MYYEFLMYNYATASMVNYTALGYAPEGVAPIAHAIASTAPGHSIVTPEQSKVIIEAYNLGRKLDSMQLTVLAYLHGRSYINLPLAYQRLVGL